MTDSKLYKRIQKIQSNVVRLQKFLRIYDGGNPDIGIIKMGLARNSIGKINTQLYWIARSVESFYNKQLANSISLREFYRMKYVVLDDNTQKNEFYIPDYIGYRFASDYISLVTKDLGELERRLGEIDKML